MGKSAKRHQPRRKPPVAVKTGRLYIPPGMTHYPLSGMPITLSIDPASVGVQPVERLTGLVSSNVVWEAVLVRGVGGRAGGRDTVRMATYSCTVTEVHREDGRLEFGPFTVRHRPEDGDIALAAKVLAMAVVQPEWDEYKRRVEDRG